MCSASPRGAQLDVIVASTVRTEIAGATGTELTTVGFRDRDLRIGEVQRSAQAAQVKDLGTDRSLAKINPLRAPNARLTRQELSVDHRATLVSTGP